MNTKKIVEALNKARARELTVIIQYMIQHYTGEGPVSPAILDLLKSTAITEMKHAEALGERISYLGGEPTKQPNPIKTGGDILQMVKDDLAAENEAIEMYRDIIKLCDQEGDPTSRVLMEDLLSEEEEHADSFQTILGAKGTAGGARRRGK